MPRPVRVGMWAGAVVLWVVGLSFLVRPVDAPSLRHATWDCGSVLRPHRFPVPPLGEVADDGLNELVAGQSACAEARDARLGSALQLTFLAVALAAPALASRRPAVP